MMPLRFNGAWRFQPPPDGEFVTSSVPEAAVAETIELIQRVATQGDRQDVLEHFKGCFCNATGSSHVWSSSASWAETDLWHYAREAATNAPLFIEALYDACASFQGSDADLFAPDVTMLNGLLERHGIGYVIRPPRLELRGETGPLVPVPERPPTLAERSVELLQQSLRRSEDLLGTGHDREAVQESLWLLETVATAFRGLETGTQTVEGRYFNQIVQELRRANLGTTLSRVLDWMTALHGYLSSPTGGGVRHGLDLNEGVTVSDNDARLLCNLVRSYLQYLLVEYQRLVRRA
jgi:hypothetical protein